MEQTRDTRSGTKRETEAAVGIIYFARRPQSAGIFSARRPAKLSGKRGKITSAKNNRSRHSFGRKAVSGCMHLYQPVYIKIRATIKIDANDADVARGESNMYTFMNDKSLKWQ